MGRTQPGRLAYIHGYIHVCPSNHFNHVLSIVHVNLLSFLSLMEGSKRRRLVWLCMVGHCNKGYVYRLAGRLRKEGQNWPQVIAVGRSWYTRQGCHNKLGPHKATRGSCSQMQRYCKCYKGKEGYITNRIQGNACIHVGLAYKEGTKACVAWCWELPGWKVQYNLQGKVRLQVQPNQPATSNPHPKEPR